MINKIYICSTNLSGKGYLLSLLDDHANIEIYPYHKFGFSSEIERFFNYLSKENYPVEKGYFNIDSDFIIPITTFNNKIYEISYGQLLHYIIKEFDSMPYLLHSHFTKKCSSYSSDKDKSISNFSFDLFLFINLFFEKFNNSNSNSYSIEQIDELLYQSFIDSMNKKTGDKIIKNNIALFGANGPHQIENLFNHYDNFKIIFIKRDPLAISYANAKRILSKKILNPSEGSIFRLMRNSSKNIQNKINLANQCADKYSGNVEKIKIIEFEKLMLDTKNTMLDISKFLNIEFEEILTRPTMYGQSVGDNKIVDDPKKSINHNHFKRIKNIYNDNNKTIKESFILLYDRVIIRIFNNKLFSKIIKLIKGVK